MHQRHFNLSRVIVCTGSDVYKKNVTTAHVELIKLSTKAKLKSEI